MEEEKFNKGFYIYKNTSNDNGRIIEIISTTRKTMVYSIYNYYDNNYKLVAHDCMVDTKKTTKRDVIKYINYNFYYPNRGCTFLESECVWEPTVLQTNLVL